MSAFDPTAFLNATVDAPLERRAPLPEGDYTAIIGEPAVRVAQGKKDPSQTYTFLDVPLTVQVPAEMQNDHDLPPTISVRDSMFLDIAESGGMDLRPGKNSGLRRYREALGMNKAGQPFSIAQMQGQALRVKVTHTLYNEQVQEQVGGIAAL